jgi:hypothetical protein
MRLINQSLVAMLVAVPLLAACGGGAKNMKAELDLTRQNKAKVAVVSMTVNDFGGTLQATSSSDVGDLITKKMNEMLGIAETRLGQSWTVVPAAGFVGTDGYKSLTSGQLFDGVYGPKLPEGALLSFASKRGELVKTQLDPTTAARLCSSLGVDLVVLVYSEWATRTGGVVPTTKALTKNVIGIYDSQGRQLYQGRKDVVGDKNLGAFGNAVVDEETMNVWVRAYSQGLAKMIAEM